MFSNRRSFIQPARGARPADRHGRLRTRMRSERVRASPIHQARGAPAGVREVIGAAHRVDQACRWTREPRRDSAVPLLRGLRRQSLRAARLLPQALLSGCRGSAVDIRTIETPEKGDPVQVRRIGFAPPIKARARRRKRGCPAGAQPQTPCPKSRPSTDGSRGGAPASNRRVARCSSSRGGLHEGAVIRRMLVLAAACAASMGCERMGPM